MNRVAAFALRRKNSILSMSEKMFCPPQPLRFWITPACAGKRRSDWIIRSTYWDHPRVCGEKPHLSRYLAAAAGRDHPRVCGEKDKTSVELAPGAGSPPRMRGKGRRVYEATHGAGITPAYAGKRRQLARPSKCVEDHPRVCGEKFAFFVAKTLKMGSPPRVRGKGGRTGSSGQHTGITPACAGKSPTCPDIWPLLRAGITPACAGKSPTATQGHRGGQDHPRVCGEKG